MLACRLCHLSLSSSSPPPHVGTQNASSGCSFGHRVRVRPSSPAVALFATRLGTNILRRIPVSFRLTARRWAFCGRWRRRCSDVGALIACAGARVQSEQATHICYILIRISLRAGSKWGWMDFDARVHQTERVHNTMSPSVVVLLSHVLVKTTTMSWWPSPFASSHGLCRVAHVSCRRGGFVSPSQANNVQRVCSLVRQRNGLNVLQFLRLSDVILVRAMPTDRIWRTFSHPPMGGCQN